MSTILFVDDEPQILRSYKRSFRKTGFTLLFAESGEEAVQLIEKESIDLIITDYRMPYMNGLEVLTYIQEKWPEVMRVIVSGQVEKKISIEIVTRNIAHSFLTKPWDNSNLHSIVINLLEFRRSVYYQHLTDLFNSKLKIPVLSETYNSVLQAYEEGKDLPHIGTIINRSPGFTAEILHIANSAFFSLDTTDINKALSFIGEDGVKTALLLSELGSLLDNERDYFEYIITHSIATNTLFQKLFNFVFHKAPERILTYVGLLHDIGILFCLVNSNTTYTNAASISDSEVELNELEIELFGVPHAFIGGFLLEYWDIPFPICELVYKHHDKIETVTKENAILAILQLADHGISYEEDETISEYDSSLLTQLTIPLEKYLAIISS